MTLESILQATHNWTISGVAGFIGSNLLEQLLKHNQHVVGLDNFATGFGKNLEEVKRSVSKEQWSRFRFVEGDIRDSRVCQNVCDGADYVLHQAALGSVPRSIKDPLTTNEVNVTGFLNMITAARDNKVKRFVFASSSSIYGDHEALPKIEDRIGQQLSPYAVSKYTNELYAKVFAETYQMSTVGLRYFNVFGPRQNPLGPYAAVIPLWIHSILHQEKVIINGDGLTSRDFCYVKNVVQANVRAAVVYQGSGHQIFNIAYGQRTTLNDLYDFIQSRIFDVTREVQAGKPDYRDFRAGDVRHSLADITKAKLAFGYNPLYDVRKGIAEAIDWYLNQSKSIDGAL